MNAKKEYFDSNKNKNFQPSYFHVINIFNYANINNFNNTNITKIIPNAIYD